MLLAAVALLARTPNPSQDEIRAALAGNLCRCTGYMRIFEAVLRAAAGERPDTTRSARRWGPARTDES